MNIIEQLYEGDIVPAEKSFAGHSEFRKCLSVLAHAEEKLEAFFDSQPQAKKEYDLFQKLIEAQNEIVILSERERFTDGFQLGARFILDTFVLHQEIFTEED